VTLLLAIVEPQAVIYVGDRRLTVEKSRNGKPEYEVVEEQYSKLITLVTDDGRFVIGLTGLGRTADGFNTLNWLWEKTRKICCGRTPIYDVLNALKNELSTQFQKISIPASNRRLTLLIAGFVFDGASRIPRCWRLSNFERSDGTQVSEAEPDFQLWSEGPEDGGLVAIAGAKSSPNKGDISKIKDLIKQGADWKALEFKAYHTVSKSRLKGVAGSTIGGNLSAVVIIADESDIIRTFYYSESAARELYALPAIIAEEVDEAWGSQGGQLIVGDLMPLITVPAKEKNTPCPCGSGLRYGKCHSKLQYSYLPISISQEAGGKKIRVSCYGATQTKRRRW